MIALGFEKKIQKIVLNFIDKTIGQKFPLIDRLTDMFQEQQIMDKKIAEMETKINALEYFLKERDK